MGLAKVKYKGFIAPLIIGLLIWFTAPVRPAGVSVAAWHMMAIFIATIAACITQPLPIAAVTLIGFTVMVLTKLVPMDDALTAFSNSSSWLIAMAFMLARGIIKTGLGHRIALYLIKAFGKKTLGLAYAVGGIDLITAPATPSNTARAGGIVYPLVESLAKTFGSEPNDDSRKKIGAFLTFSEFHSNIITSAMFMTALAPNLVIVALAKTMKIHISWLGWFTASVVPCLLLFVLVPFVIYKMYPPEIKETPNAREWADKSLREMGPMKVSEKVMAGVFILTIVLWMMSNTLGIEASFVAFLAISLLLIFGVLTTKDLLSETGAWNVLIWLSILVFMAGELSEMGLIKWLSKLIASGLHGMNWVAVLAILMVIYFYAHYLFASATAHVTALYAPFVDVAISAGAPAMLAAMLLAFCSAIMASTTHYANGPASILASSGYVKQGEWWRMSFVLGLLYLVVFLTVAPLWMKVIGMW